LSFILNKPALNKESKTCSFYTEIDSMKGFGIEKLKSNMTVNDISGCDNPTKSANLNSHSMFSLLLDLFMRKPKGRAV